MSNDDSSTNTSSNILKYLITTTIAVILIIIYYVVSGLVLYGTKVAASGIIPTDTNYYPYTEGKQKVTLGEVVSNIFTTFTTPVLSEKISFYPKKEGTSLQTGNFVLNYIRNYKSSSNKSLLMNYVIAIIESLLSFDYWVLNQSLGLLNKLPELIIVIFGPIVISFLTGCLIIVNYMYLMFLWFYKMSLFFHPIKKQQKPVPSVNPENPNNGLIYGFFLIFWETIFGDTQTNNGGNTLTDLIMGGCMVGVFTILFFILLLLGWGFFPAILTFYCLFSIVSYASEINDTKTTALDVITRLFRFYKTTITAVISFVCVSSTFSFLGAKLGIVSAVVLLLIVFFGMGISLFKAEKIEGLTPEIDTPRSSIGGNSKSNIDKLLSQAGGGGGADFIKAINKITKKFKDKQ